MPICSNPECPYLKKIGEAAEFIEGVTHCPDCGALLTEKTINKERETKIVFTDFHKRLGYTFALLILFRALTHIAVPGIDFQAIIDSIATAEGELNNTSFSRLSVLALGLMPYISAYLLVEIMSLFLPPLKTWRTEGYQGRMKLKRTALLGTLVLALIQGYGIAQGLEGMFGEKAVLNPGLGYKLFFILTLTAGTFLTIWIAEQITKKGIGHGISVLIITKYSWEFFLDFIRINKEYYKDYSRSPIEIFLIIAIIGAALIALIVVFEKGRRKIPIKFSDGKEAYLPLKLTTAGIVPANLATTIIALPLTFLGYIINPPLYNTISALFYHNNISYYFVYSITTILLYFLLTLFFYNPKKIMAFSKNALFASKAGKAAADYINHNLKIMSFYGSFYLCLLILIPEIIILFFNFPIYLVEGTELIIVVAVVLDLMEEISARKRIDNMVKIAEFHDLPKAGIAKGLLESKGIPCFMKGYYHRALLYFFGPYIEISLLVPEDKRKEAEELIKLIV